jgi:ankyrin repeat protein
MLKQLPERPSLEHLKNEAKALKKSQSLSKLSDAQLALAREYGFPSWSKLKRYVEGYDSLRDEFFNAIGAGDRDRVQKVLSEAPGLVRSHNPHSFGSSAIGAAAGRNDLPMIDLLLKAGADVDARSDWWAGSFGGLDYSEEKTAQHLLKHGATLTPHAAARLGMAKELRDFIKKDPDCVNQRGGDGQFPLHFAKTAEIVDILVEAGANLDARDLDHESTAAQWRIKNENVLRRLVHHGAGTDIFMAVALDDPALMQEHLKDDPNALTRKTNEPGNPMIHHAAPGGPIYIYEIGQIGPLQFAAHMEKKAAFDFLFEHSPPAVKLIAAIWKGDRELALKFKEEIKNLPKNATGHICDAARFKRADVLKLMLEMGFDVNVQDSEGMSAVMWSGFHGWREGMELILPYKPDLTVKNVYGGTALGTLSYGSVNGWYKDAPFAECAELLIKAGAVVTDQMSGTAAVNAVLDKYR